MVVAVLAPPRSRMVACSHLGGGRSLVLPLHGNLTQPEQTVVALALYHSDWQESMRESTTVQIKLTLPVARS